MSKIQEAIKAFQSECPVIKNEDQGYGYSYTGLEKLFNVIKPIMDKNEIIHTFLMNYDNGVNTLELILKCGDDTLVSKMGIPNNVQLAKMNTFQVLGAGITYLKRYLIVSALGIICSDSPDADHCLPGAPPASTEGRDVRSAHTKKKVTGKQIDTGDIL